MQVKKIAIVYNPKGGSASQKTVNEVAGCFISKGVQVSFLATTPAPGSAARLAAESAAGGAELIVSFGGDGTACQVAQGLMGTGIPMAVYPGGTGNLFARAFYSEPTPAQFAQMVLDGQPQPVDMIRADYQDGKGQAVSSVFMVGCGLGKVSDAISTASPFFKRILGRLFYVLRVTLACLWPGARKFQLTTPGSQSQEEAAALFVLNVTPPSMATISRGCNASDGLMDVVVFRARNAFELAGVAACLAFGKPERSRFYRRFRTSELTVRSSKPMLPNIDGDPGAWTREIRLTVEPAAALMILS